MTPTNPAAPPVGSAQATPEALAIVRDCGIDCPDIDEARAIDALAQARVDAATRELRHALAEAVVIRRHTIGQFGAADEPLKRWEALLERMDPR